MISNIYLSPALQALFYFTPTFYPLSYVPKQWLRWYLLNPMAGDHRTVSQHSGRGLACFDDRLQMAVITSLVTLAAGVFVFRRSGASFR